MNRRRGYSLIEMLVAMTLVATTLSTIGLVLHSLHRAERRLRDDVDFERTVNRLATQLRTDAHNAQGGEFAAVAANATHARTFASSSEQTVTYSIEPGGVERRVRRGAALQHREWFAIPNSVLTWNPDTAEPPNRLATLLVSRRNDHARKDQLEFATIRIDFAESLDWPARGASSKEQK